MVVTVYDTKSTPPDCDALLRWLATFGYVVQTLTWIPAGGYSVTARLAK